MYFLLVAKCTILFDIFKYLPTSIVLLLNLVSTKKLVIVFPAPLASFSDKITNEPFSFFRNYVTQYVRHRCVNVVLMVVIFAVPNLSIRTTKLL